MAAPRDRDPFGRDNLDEDREILDIIPERFDADPDSRHARRAAVDACGSWGEGRATV